MRPGSFTPFGVVTALLFTTLGTSCPRPQIQGGLSTTRPVEVRYRFGEPPDQAGQRAISELPGSRWDPGLLDATRELAQAELSPRGRLTPKACTLALARAGFPGDARFAREVNGGEFPTALIQSAREVAAEAVVLDIALTSSVLPDTSTLWILGAAPHRGDFDPIPRDLRLDDSVAIRADVPDSGRLLLFVAPPAGPVSTMALSNHVAHAVDTFHLPGEYRLEIVDEAIGKSRVVHEFSLFVEREPPPPRPLPESVPTPNPALAASWLYDALDARREAAGLSRLRRFPAFEALAREHSAFMASTGILDHVIPGVTQGVAAQAWRRYHPGAKHIEDLAVAFTPEDALELAWQSPGHRKNLLCEECTHVSIGVALEPVLDSLPRLFVTWELLSFPQGEPREIERPH